MKIMNSRYLIFLSVLLFSSSLMGQVIVGAEQSELYLSQLKEKSVALMVNQTSRVEEDHLIEFLIAKKINLKKIFALEHGLRGQLDAGEEVQSGVDIQTGLPVISLYGKNKKPTSKQLQDVDVIVFDIQDVGVRFFTYISSLYYVLEAAGEHNKEVLILDRPNPLGHYVSGPVLDKEFKSFVGMYPIPVVHGLTIGELAQMALGEKWISPAPRLNIIPVKNYTHQTRYSLPIKPSPNLPNDQAISLYPSLALLEPTVVSVGRGTFSPFQVIGHPEKVLGEYRFTPKSIEGMSKNPKHQDKLCYGINLKNYPGPSSLDLSFLVKSYQKFSHKLFTSPSFFNKLVGNGKLIEQLKAGVSIKDIEKSWENELNKFKQARKKYLIYPY